MSGDVTKKRTCSHCAHSDRVIKMIEGGGSRSVSCAFVHFNRHHFISFQIERLLAVREQLCLSGLSSELQPLPAQLQQDAAGFGSGAAVWFSHCPLETLGSVTSFYVCTEIIWCERFYFVEWNGFVWMEPLADVKSPRLYWTGSSLLLILIRVIFTWCILLSLNCSLTCFVQAFGVSKLL